MLMMLDVVDMDMDVTMKSRGCANVYEALPFGQWAIGNPLFPLDKIPYCI
jgi:hypothetical protein